MYGSHYSCPGYVMFWLVRAAPGHLLRLQSGRFDAPDRMFCNIKEAWDSVTSSSADVKELIPEFFLSDARSACSHANVMYPRHISQAHSTGTTMSYKVMRVHPRTSPLAPRPY